MFKYFFSLLILLSLTARAQVDTLAQNHHDDKIWFSTIPNTPQKSLEPFYKALSDSDYGVQRFSVIAQLADYHIDKGNSDSILHYGNLYLRELQNWDGAKNEKSKYRSEAYLILGLGNKYNGLLDNALRWHIKGITVSEGIQNPEFHVKNKLGLANIYNLQGKAKKAMSILEDVLPPIEKEIPKLLADALTYYGDSHYELNDYKTAEANYQNALTAAKKTGNLKQELTLYLKLGTLAELNDAWDKALDLYEKTKEEGLKKGFNTLYFEGCIRIGKLFYKQKNYEAVKMSLSIAYYNAIERENLEYQREILEINRRTFADDGDYSNAYAIMTQLANVNRQIAERQQKKVIKELEVQYETLQKEKAISKLEEGQLLQEAELKRQKTIQNAFLIGFLIILIPILALLYVYYQKIQAQSELSQKQEEINIQKVTALKQNQELDLIKAAIEGQDEERKRIAQELHDSIGGNLAGIKLQLSGVAENQDKIKSISGQIDETYQLVRNISHTLIPKKFRENDFTDVIREYVRSISSSGAIKIGFHAHPAKAVNALDEKTHMEVFKIIQELMTNTLKHANAKKIEINLSILNNELSLLFEDDGKGFDTSQMTEGIGFKNIKSRIKALNGTSHFDSAENRGTVVSLEIPINLTTA